MKKYILILVAFIPILLLQMSCKKKDNNAGMGTLYFHLHTDVDTNEVGDYGIVYTTSTGRKIAVDKAQMYLSHIELIRTDGTTYPISGVIVLKSQETEEYYLSKVPAGTYKSIKFDVGLDATQNALPSTADTALNHSEMWYGATAQPGGYMFINFQGSVDTTTNGNGTAADMRPFMYFIGTNAHLTTITMPNHSPSYTITDGQTQFVHIKIDYNKLLDGIQLNNPMNLMVMMSSDNSSVNANAVANNIPGMFSYEE